MPELWQSNDDRDRVRAATDIVRLVGEHVALKPKGREYAGICPFHDDHRPSMNVVPSKQIFHCFVCGTGGDAFSFVQRYFKMEFREALEFLAERGGVKLTPRRAQPPSTDSPRSSRAEIVQASAFAAEFFRAILRHPEHGQAARDVIARRAISPEMVQQFGLGASPARWDGLLLTVQNKSLDTRPFTDAGLFKRRDSGDGVYDSFRNRLMFPIQDAAGRVIAFGARKIDEADEPKYLNSSEHAAFNKSATLYALPQAQRTIQSSRVAIITEGYTDAIACHQAGFTNAVATLGTALTREHATVLRRLCDTVVLLFDGDMAGQKAAERAVEVFFAETLDVKIALMSSQTDAKDPDELLKREGGADVFRKVIDGAIDLLDFRFRKLRERTKSAGPAALTRAITDEIKRLVELGLADQTPIRRKLIVRQLATIAGVDEATILAEIPAGRGGRRPAFEPRPNVEPKPGAAPVDRSAAAHVLACVLAEGGLWHALSEPEQRKLVEGPWNSPALADVAQAVSSVAAQGRDPGLSAVLSIGESPEFQQAAVALSQAIEQQSESDPDRLNTYFEQCRKRMAIETGRSEPAPNATGEEDAMSKLARLQQQHRELGPDRRVMPRPK
ncbi:MAG: DNA primase [Phycisphaerales bacterium]